MNKKEQALETLRRAILLSESLRALPFRHTSIEISEDKEEARKWHPIMKMVAEKLEPKRDQLIEEGLKKWLEYKLEKQESFKEELKS